MVPDQADPESCQRCGWMPRRGQLWPTYGELACDWIEEYCIFGEGDSYGKPFRLYEDQQRFVFEWYEGCPECHQWRYSEGVWGAATGSGKTQFVAALGALEFAGPPEIAPLSANVVIAAAAWDQAGLLFSQCGIMLGGKGRVVTEAPLREFFEVYENKIVFADHRPGQVIRVAAVAGTNEGGNPTLFLADEVHAWGDVGDPKARLHAVIGKSTTKRSLKCVADGREVDRGRGRVVNLSTAGFDVEQSLLGAIYMFGKRAAADRSVAPRMLFHWREAREGLDFSVPGDRATACRDASGAAGLIWSVADRVAEWDKPQLQHHEWIRYYANRFVDVSDESWLAEHPAAWGACKGSWVLTGDEPAVLAIDLSLSRDSTAVVEVTRLHDGRVAATARIWMPRRGVVVPHKDVSGYVVRRIGELGDRFRGVVYDPALMEQIAEDIEDAGVVPIEFSQAPVWMAPACGLAFDLIVGTESAGPLLVHDGDEEFGLQVKGAVRRQQERGFTLSKGKSKRKIDAAVALCMAVEGLQRLEEVPDPMGMFW